MMKGCILSMATWARGFFFFCLWLARALPAAAACLPGATETVTLRDVDDHWDLVTDQGTLLHLNGVENLALDSDQDDKLYDASEFLKDWLVGTPVLLQRVSSGPDRWQRLDVQLFAAQQPDSPPQSVAVALVGAGLARVQPGAEATACLPELLAAEAEARAAKRGIWAEPDFAVLAADNRAALAAKLGKFVVVEGRVTASGESRTRVYLNFGTSRWRDLAITILKRDEKAFDKAGLSPKSLVGTTVRLRGILDRFYGPEIELSNPQNIEIINRP
jgi:hypothetical protein